MGGTTEYTLYHKLIYLWLTVLTLVWAGDSSLYVLFTLNIPLNIRNEVPN